MKHFIEPHISPIIAVYINERGEFLIESFLSGPIWDKARIVDELLKTLPERFKKEVSDV